MSIRHPGITDTSPNHDHGPQSLEEAIRAALFAGYSYGATAITLEALSRLLDYRRCDPIKKENFVG